MVAETTIDVQVVRLKIRLLKVSFTGGHQLVVGGRLVSETRDGKTTPYRDLPAYTPERFPVPFDDWANGRADGVSVSVFENGKSTPKDVRPVRAYILLFTERNVRTVTDWLRSQA